VQRLYRQSSGRDLLCKPLDKITLSHDGLIAFIYEDFCNDLLENYQPSNAPEFLSQNFAVDNLTQHAMAESFISIQQFLDFAIQCCDCLEMIHKHQSIYPTHVSNIQLLIALNCSSCSWRDQIECIFMAKE